MGRSELSENWYVVSRPFRETGSVSGKKNSIPASHPTFSASQTSLKLTLKSSLTGSLPVNQAHCILSLILSWSLMIAL